MNAWASRRQEHELRLALDAVLLLAAERVADMRDTCKAKAHAIGSMRVVNEWVAARSWPYDE